MSSLEGDQLLQMFNLNQTGFVKRKEMQMNKRFEIFGLNSTQEGAAKGNPVFDSLYGEVIIKHYSKNV